MIFFFQHIKMEKMLAFSKFAKIGNFDNAFKISPTPSKFCHFLHFGENFASLATLNSIHVGL